MNKNSEIDQEESFNYTPKIENNNQSIQVLLDNKSAISEQTRQPRKQRFLEEIHIKELNECQNLVYTPQNNLQQKQQGSSLLKKEWTQIFDLENTILICKVQGSVLEMHLMHLNQQPKQQFQLSQANGNIFESRNQKKNEYQLPQESEKFKSAQFIFEGNIVPNIHLLTNNSNQNNGFNGQFILTLATTINQYYNIEFIPYILKREESLRVNGPYEIEIDQQYTKIHLTNSVLKSFELAVDPETLSYVHVYGLGLSPNYHQDALQDIGQSLHISYQQNASISLSNKRLLKSVYKNIVGGAKTLGEKANKLTAILGQNLMSSFFQKNDIQENMNEQEEEGDDYMFQNDEQMQYSLQHKIKQANLYTIIGNEEGVIQLKYISSYSLISAVFSDGTFILRPVSSYHEIQNNDCKNLVELNLIQIAKQSESFDLQQSNNDDLRITDAKMCHLAVQQLVNNTEQEHLKLAIAYEIQDQTDSQKIWRVVEFKINLRLFSRKNPDRQNYYELIPQENDSQPLEIIDYEQIMETQNINCKVTQIQMDPILMENENYQDSKQYSILINVWNQKSNEGFIKDIKQNTQVFDTQTNETLNLIQDSSSFQQESNSNFLDQNQNQQNIKKGQENAMNDHIIKNVMKLNRFQPKMVAQFLKENVELQMSSNLTVEQELEQVLNRLPKQDLLAFKERLCFFKKQCSRLLALDLSPVLNNKSLKAQRKQQQIGQQTNQIKKLGAQFIFRNQLGISILKEVKEPQEFYYGISQLSIELKFQKIKMNQILNAFQKSTFLDQIIEDLKKELLQDLNQET